MSKSIKDAPLSSRAGRERLKQGLHWRALDPEVHLGFRKGPRAGARAGRWLVRWRTGKGYNQATLATADDILEADGRTTLNFDQANRAARNHVQAARVNQAAEAAGPVQSVLSAAEAYADAVEARQVASGRAILRDCRSRFRNHVFDDEIARTKLFGLQAGHIRKWRERLNAKGMSPSSQQRCYNDLRAALNEAGRVHAANLPDRFLLEVRDGFLVSTRDRAAVATRPNVVLPDADVRRLIGAAREIDAERDWGGDLVRLVVGLAATGARFSQLARCRVADLQLDTRRIMVPVSRKGRGVKAATHIAVAIGDDVIAELRPVIAGRRGQDSLLQRWGFRRVGRLQWEKDRRRSWLAAEISEPFRAIVKRAELSTDVTAYSLRHSSIVRGLRAALPVRLVAALHDTSSEMIEKHYSAYIVDAMTEAARLAVIPLAASADIVALKAVSA